MEHVIEKRTGVRTEVLIPAKVQEQNGRERLVKAVSYTHLTLPTIRSV